jgi:hypothetical protein
LGWSLMHPMPAHPKRIVSLIEQLAASRRRAGRCRERKHRRKQERRAPAHGNLQNQSLGYILGRLCLRSQISFNRAVFRADGREAILLGLQRFEVAPP